MFCCFLLCIPTFIYFFKACFWQLHFCIFHLGEDFADSVFWNQIKMSQGKPLSAKVVVSVLTSVLYLACLLANGLVLALITRFKSLRTVPNIFFANLAVVDLLSGAINTPLYVISYEWEASWFKGKTLAILTSSFNRLFTVLNLVSMLTMLTNI